MSRGLLLWRLTGLFLLGSGGAAQSQDVIDRARGLNPFTWSGLEVAAPPQSGSPSEVFVYEPPPVLPPREAPPLLRFKATEGADRGVGLYMGPAGLALSEAPSSSESNFFVGVGVDIRLNERISIGGEVLYDTRDDFRGAGEMPATANARVTFSF